MPTRGEDVEIHASDQRGGVSAIARTRQESPDHCN